MQLQGNDNTPPTPPGGFPVSSHPPSPQIDPIKANIAEAVYERRDEYLVRKKIRIKVGTWNVASISGTEKDLKNWFVDELEITDHLASLKLHEEAEESGDDADIARRSEEHTKQSERHEDATGSEPGDDMSEPQEIGLYVLGLQEIVDISSPTQLLNPYVDPAPAQRWKHAVEEALPLGYQPVAEQQLVGLYLLVYASPLVKPSISDVACVHVPTGGIGWTGNKGAVAVRIVLGEATRMLFVDSHLSAGNEIQNLDRRIWDVGQIVSRAKFPAVEDELDPSPRKTETIGDEDFAFWFGDLNFRLDGIPGDDVRRLLMLHTKGKYGQQQKLSSEINDLAYGDSNSELEAASTITEKSSSSVTLVGEEAHGEDKAPAALSLAPKEHPQSTHDPTSLQSTLQSLLSHDQLRGLIQQQRAFHDGWEEGDITFLPTYKYDIGSLDMFDSSEKMRGPSFCDRILYRTKKRRARIEKERLAATVQTPQFEEQPAGVLFQYNPDEDAEPSPAQPPSNRLTNSICVTSDIELKYYSSHQKITSSDHKPLSALFTVCYSVEDQKRKSNIYWKVARMLDITENEGRPRVTIVSNPIAFTDDRTLNFENIHFGTYHKNEIAVANTGTRPATLRLARETSQSRPDWLTITGWNGPKVVQVGDVAMFRVEVFVTNPETARRLNSGEETLEYVLVVQVEDGGDHFVVIKGDWMAS